MEILLKHSHCNYWGYTFLNHFLEKRRPCSIYLSCGIQNLHGDNFIVDICLVAIG